jgi:nitrous oxidase accessory protein NosD
LYGINLGFDSFNSSIFNNNFINNSRSVLCIYFCNTTWDSGYSAGGNFWSDYLCADLYSGPYQNVTGSDGIGDKPYSIVVVDSAYNVIGAEFDYYPLTRPVDVEP